jgi:hypothetical protein
VAAGYEGGDTADAECRPGSQIDPFVELHVRRLPQLAEAERELFRV